MKINNQKIRDRIVELYKKDPSIVDDDDRLIATIWWCEGWRDPELYKRMKSVSSSETIRRTRRKLQQEGIISSSEKVQELRYKEFKNARKDLGYVS